MTPRALIADDHAPTRAGVRRALEADGFTVCAEAATAEGAVAAALRERPDVCLLDIRMPGNGLTAAEAIARELTETRIVVLTVSRDDDDLFRALRLGAVGFLLKDIERGRLSAALRGVLAGETQLPPSLLTRLVAEFRGRETGKHRVLSLRPGVQLTAREWEILQLLHRGDSTKQIAQQLFIAEVTVRTHVSALLRKLDVPTREAAARLLDPAVQA